jgi:hypothetical protein
VAKSVTGAKPWHWPFRLQRYLSGDFTAAEVEEWASAIECRDDIDTSDFRDIIFQLASPDITRQLSPGFAQDLLIQIVR